MATIEERIAALEAKLKKEKAKKQQIEARKRVAESKAKRSQDTRRKILVGAAILAKVEPAVLPDPAPEAHHPAERMDAPVDLPAMDEGDENLAELPPAEMAWPAQELQIGRE